MSSGIDHGGNVALRKIGNPESYSVCGWTAISDDTVVYRMMPEIERDAKGFRRWSGEEKIASVTRAEEDQEMKRHETETGRCARCDGSKQQWAGWNKDSGHRYVPCRRCGATGIAGGSNGGAK